MKWWSNAVQVALDKSICHMHECGCVVLYHCVDDLLCRCWSEAWLLKEEVRCSSPVRFVAPWNPFSSQNREKSRGSEEQRILPLIIKPVWHSTTILVCFQYTFTYLYIRGRIHKTFHLTTKSSPKTSSFKPLHKAFTKEWGGILS